MESSDGSSSGSMLLSDQSFLPGFAGPFLVVGQTLSGYPIRAMLSSPNGIVSSVKQLSLHTSIGVFGSNSNVASGFAGSSVMPLDERSKHYTEPASCGYPHGNCQTWHGTNSVCVGMFGPCDCAAGQFGEKGQCPTQLISLRHNKVERARAVQLTIYLSSLEAITRTLVLSSFRPVTDTFGLRLDTPYKVTSVSIASNETFSLLDVDVILVSDLSVVYRSAYRTRYTISPQVTHIPLTADSASGKCGYLYGGCRERHGSNSLCDLSSLSCKCANSDALVSASDLCAPTTLSTTPVVTLSPSKPAVQLAEVWFLSLSSDALKVMEGVKNYNVSIGILEENVAIAITVVPKTPDSIKISRYDEDGTISINGESAAGSLSSVLQSSLPFPLCLQVFVGLQTFNVCIYQRQLPHIVGLSSSSCHNHKHGLSNCVHEGEITIVGEHFFDQVTVGYVGERLCQPYLVGTSGIVCELPANDLTLQDLGVRVMHSGQLVEARPTHYISFSGPIVTSFESESCVSLSSLHIRDCPQMGNFILTIQGLNFGNHTAVMIGEKECLNALHIGSGLTCVVPRGFGNHRVLLHRVGVSPFISKISEVLLLSYYQDKLINYECVADMCICRSGFVQTNYSEDGKPICRICPKGADCIRMGTTLQNLKGLQGYYTADKGVFYACEHVACLGERCMQGHHGKLCGQCSTNYYRSTETRRNKEICQRCPATNWLIVLGRVSVILVVLMQNIFFMVKSQGTVFFALWQKVVISTFHVNYIILHFDFGTSDSVHWLRHVLGAVSSVDSPLSTITCGTSRSDSLFIQGLISLFLPIVFFLLSTFTIVLSMARLNKNEQYLSLDVKNNIKVSIVAIALFVYPAVSWQGFQLFNCRLFGADRFLHLDPGSECFTLAYWKLHGPLGVLFVLMWIIGTPLYIFRKLYQKRAIFPPEQTQSFLLGYKQAGICYYWELVVMARKLLLTMIAVFGGENLNLKLSLAMLVCIISLGLQLSYTPFVHSSLNRLENASLITSFAIIYVGNSFAFHFTFLLVVSLPPHSIHSIQSIHPI